jgi:hypothetical protein
VATLSGAPPQIDATILAYLAASVFAIVPYAAWRCRGAVTRTRRSD